PLNTVAASKVNSMNSSPLAAIWHWYPLLAWVACARFCSLPLGSLSYLNFYLKLRLDSNFSYGTGLTFSIDHQPVQIGTLNHIQILSDLLTQRATRTDRFINGNRVEN